MDFVFRILTIENITFAEKSLYHTREQCKTKYFVMSIKKELIYRTKRISLE